ncbi:DUF2316 family protein [Lactiplantibacillus carotarum]|uniref:DUF2316 family protein n=1 Tax=Lactiplantibacillus carotarum TaxID=2993456 RepID=UPI00298F2438|nr:DUF2316 family protein [Lactiplantibacillus carotarum]
MSLTPEQFEQTRQEIQANFKLTGLSKEQIASDLRISRVKLDRLFELSQRSYNDPFIFRDYLREKVVAAGHQPVPFSAMGEDVHHYWFLDPDIIERREMTPGDD